MSLVDGERTRSLDGPATFDSEMLKRPAVLAEKKIEKTLLCLFYLQNNFAKGMRADMRNGVCRDVAAFPP